MSIKSAAVRNLLAVLSLASLFALGTAGSATSRPTSTASPATQTEGFCFKRHARKRCSMVVARASAQRSRDTTPPTVSWRLPAAGQAVKGAISGNACEVAASDNRGVTRVVFRVDGTALNTESDAPWNCNFTSTSVADGSHTLTATAYDGAGNSRSASQAIVVANGTPPAPVPDPAPAPSPPGDSTPPSVNWQAPTSGVTISGQIEGSACEVSATDSNGIQSVVFKVDGTTLNTESDAPWNCRFDSTKVVSGSHTLTATAYDPTGNSQSVSRTVTVANAPAPAPSPEPTPSPSPSPSGMIVGLDAGNYGTAGAADVRGAVNTVRYETELGVSALENFKKAGLRIQMNFSGPYNSGGVCALNATTWVADALAFYKANTTPTQTPVIEALNEPGGTWFWGSSAASASSATCYRELLRKTYAAFHAQYGSSAPKILGTLDGSGGLAFGKLWVTSDWATYVDGFIVHPYGGTGSRTSSAIGNRTRVEEARAMTGGPIYVTEVGWPTATGQSSTSDSLQWSEAEQATNIADFIRWAHDTGYVSEVIYFNYHDFGTKDWYGVVRSDGSHKPAYEALRQAATLFGV